MRRMLALHDKGISCPFSEVCLTHLSNPGESRRLLEFRHREVSWCETWMEDAGLLRNSRRRGLQNVTPRNFNSTPSTNFLVSYQRYLCTLDPTPTLVIEARNISVFNCLPSHLLKYTSLIFMASSSSDSSVNRASPVPSTASSVISTDTSTATPSTPPTAPLSDKGLADDSSKLKIFLGILRKYAEVFPISLHRSAAFPRRLQAKRLEEVNALNRIEA